MKSLQEKLARAQAKRRTFQRRCAKLEALLHPLIQATTATDEATSAPTLVAATLKRLRRNKLQCNQAALAKLLGVSLSTVAKWETGQVQPSAMACIALSKIDIEHSEWWVARAGKHSEAVKKPDTPITSIEVLIPVKHDPFRGVLAKVAKQLNLSHEHVRQVAYGLRTSKRVGAALRNELALRNASISAVKL